MGPQSLEPPTLWLLGKGLIAVVCESCLGSQLSDTKGLRWGLHPVTTADAWISMPPSAEATATATTPSCTDLEFAFCLCDEFFGCSRKKLILLIPPSGH